MICIYQKLSKTNQTIWSDSKDLVDKQHLVVQKNCGAGQFHCKWERRNYNMQEEIVKKSKHYKNEDNVKKHVRESKKNNE